jgi:hypothetical protein
MTNENRNTLSAARFALLHPDFPRGCWLEQSDESALRYAVWSPERDIIGASDDEDEAIAEARETVRQLAINDVDAAIKAGESR